MLILYAVKLMPNKRIKMVHLSAASVIRLGFFGFARAFVDLPENTSKTLGIAQRSARRDVCKFC